MEEAHHGRDRPQARHLAQRLLSDRGVAALEADRADDIVGHGGVVDLLHLLHVLAGRLFDEEMLAGVEAVQRRLQDPAFVHHAVDQVGVDLLQHATVVVVAVLEVVGRGDLVQQFLVQFAGGHHLHFGQAVDVGIVGAPGCGAPRR